MTTTPVNPQRRFSTRLIRKGALIEETYSAFRSWNLDLDMKTNWAWLRNENPIGASNSAWLREIVDTLSSRFRSTAEIAPLVMLAHGGYPLAKWRACLLWHVGQQDALVHNFLCDWLFDTYRTGVPRVRTDNVVPFVIEQTAGKLARGLGLSAYGQKRAASDLLRMASDFGLLKGRVVREFTGYRLPDEAFLYVMHALLEQEQSPQRAVEAREWRMFLFSSADVERELLRLHQFQRVEYHAAGSLIQLTLPAPTLLAYAESLIR